MGEAASRLSLLAFRCMCFLQHTEELHLHSVRHEWLAQTDFYFDHSYHVSIEENDYVTALCNYIYDFPATIEKDNIFAAQFHPEKSQLYGYQLLKNFLNFCKEGSKLDAKS